MLKEPLVVNRLEKQRYSPFTLETACKSMQFHKKGGFFCHFLKKEQTLNSKDWSTSFIPREKEEKAVCCCWFTRYPHKNPIPRLITQSHIPPKMAKATGIVSSTPSSSL